MTDLTPGDPIEKIRDVQNVSPRGLTKVRKFQLPAATVVALTAMRNITPLFSRAEVYV